MHEFLHALEHSFLDSLKMLPFLFLAFLFLEFTEARIEQKSAKAIEKAEKSGPITGALLGLIPQCGFSVIGANFFAKRIITLGTLIAIFLSTSDEALLIMLASPSHYKELLIIMGLKLVVAVIAGYAIDFFVGKKKIITDDCHHCHHHDDSCEDEEIIGEEHCCSHTDWRAIVLCTVKRTASVFAFLFIATFLLTFAIEFVGEDKIGGFMLTDSIFQPFLTALIGLIPNCAPSVILAGMFVEGAISLGSVFAGLCTSAGVGLLVLFRVNKGLKDNLLAVGLLYIISCASGIIIHLCQGLF